jgi:hypothetical protein
MHVCPPPDDPLVCVDLNKNKRRSGNVTRSGAKGRDIGTSTARAAIESMVSLRNIDRHDLVFARTGLSLLRGFARGSYPRCAA